MNLDPLDKFSVESRGRFHRIAYQRQTVISSDPPRMWPFLRGFHERPNLQYVLGPTQNNQGRTIRLPFLLLSNQSDVRFRLTITIRLARVFRPVEYQYLTRRAFSGNQIGVLRHVSSLIDFSRMNYLLNDLNLGCRRDGVTPNLSPFVVPIEVYIAFRKVDCCDLKVILSLV